MSGAAGAAGAPRDASRKLVGILCAVGASLAWGAGATTTDFVLKGGVGNDTFLVLELGIGFMVVLVIAALRGEFGGFRHPNIGRAALTGLIEPWGADRKSTRLNSSHSQQSRMPSSA